MNNSGERPNDFDLNQISSTVRGLYSACKAVREAFVDMIEYSPERKTAHAQVIIPIIVYEGDIFEYRIQRRKPLLKKSKCVEVHSPRIGEADRLEQCPYYIVSLNYFKQFLANVVQSSYKLRSDALLYRVDQLSK